MTAEPPTEAADGRETCPTCWRPFPAAQRGDHDYGLSLPDRAAAEGERIAPLVEAARRAFTEYEEDRLRCPSFVTMALLEEALAEWEAHDD